MLIQFVSEFGLFGLFIVSGLGATIFIPFSAEMSFPVLVGASIPDLHILAAATGGAYIGTVINYAIGYKGGKYALKDVAEKDLKKAQDMMNKYGWFGIMGAMVIPLPLPVDPITILCGIARMDFLRFSAAIIAGKGLKYAILLGILAFIL